MPELCCSVAVVFWSAGPVSRVTLSASRGKALLFLNFFLLGHGSSSCVDHGSWLKLAKILKKESTQWV